MQKTTATAKRNLLLLQIGIQLVCSAFTFALYYFQPQAQWQSALQYYSEMGASLKPYLYSAAPWMIAFYFIWLGGKTVHLIMAWRQFAAHYKTGLQKPSIDLRLFTKVTADHMGIKQKVQLWLSDNIHTPITFGHFKPVILLPVALVNQVSLQQAEALIIHELTHIKVKDYLLNWLLTIAETIYFFNPFIVYLCNQAKLEREKYCDSNVLYFGKQPVAYAETLLLAAKLQQMKVRWQLAAIGNKKQLLHRISFFTSNAPFQVKKTKTGLTLVPLLSAMVLFIMVMVMTMMPGQNKSDRQTQLPVSAIPTAYWMPQNEPVNEGVGGNAEERPVIIASVAPSQPTALPLIPKKPTVQVDKSIGRNNGLIENDTETPFIYPAGAQPVAFSETSLMREVVVEEEVPGTNFKTIKIFTLSFKNGNWVMEPKWMATSRKVAVDTALLRMDSLQIRLVDSQ